MKHLLFVSLFLLFATYSQAKEHRPFKEMHGDCKEFALAKKADFLAWEKKDSEDGTLRTGEPAQLALTDQNKFEFLSTPGKKPKEKGNAGITFFTVPKDGKYRLSLGAKIWADVVDKGSKQNVEPTSFEMQTNCSKIYKVLEFSLAAGKSYALQLSNGKFKMARVLLMPVAE